MCDRFTRETDGLFAPLVGAAMAAWGYEVSKDERAPGAAASPVAEPVRRDPLVFDARRSLVEVPRGALLDLGGIAKAWSCARAAAVAAQLSDEPSLLVEAGGDLVAARGDHVVAIEDSTRSRPSGDDQRAAARGARDLHVGLEPTALDERRRHRGAPSDRPGPPGCRRRAARRR